MRRGFVLASSLLAGLAAVGPLRPGASVAEDFDHHYTAYAAVLRDHVVSTRVDYRKLVRNRGDLDAVVRQFEAVPRAVEEAWTPARRIAFWINAYNAFTLRAIVDHYPIQGSWFSLNPRNSIRQIGGVWDRLRWNAAGRSVTLDEIEHQILRPVFNEPRVHFAVNCASVSCPPLRAEPYRADVLDRQLDDSASRFLASAPGLQVAGTTLRVSSIFKWYGEDFVPAYAPLGPAGYPERDRAILGAVLRHGPAAAADLVRAGRVRIAFLSYDWSLNDVAAPSS
jgi:hypothetical protein